MNGHGGSEFGGHGRGGRGFFGGVIHAIVVGAIMGGAFLIGCFLDFMKHPMEWIGQYWFPVLLILVGTIGCFADHRKPGRFR